MMQDLIASKAASSGQLRAALAEALAARGSDRERAWALRAALDRVLAS